VAPLAHAELGSWLPPHLVRVGSKNQTFQCVSVMPRPATHSVLPPGPPDRRVLTDVLEQRRLTNTRFAVHHQRAALARADIFDEIVQHSPLGGAADQRLPNGALLATHHPEYGRLSLHLPVTRPPRAPGTDEPLLTSACAAAPDGNLVSVCRIDALRFV